MDEVSQRRAVKDMTKAMSDGQRALERALNDLASKKDALEVLNRELEAIGVPRDAEHLIATSCVLLGFVAGRAMRECTDNAPGRLSTLVSSLADVRPDAPYEITSADITCETFPGVHAFDAIRLTRVLRAGMAEMYYALVDRQVMKKDVVNKDTLWSVAIAASSFLVNFYCLLAPPPTSS